ncbi:MAG: hypothetical protein C0631_16675 [Sedimenticola sp.]|nr:MAG: hypothetical protein C0631_16675 [Sedimenticola sp.]
MDFFIGGQVISSAGHYEGKGVMHVPKIRLGYLLPVLLIGCLMIEPSLAGNKFETIGKGVSGTVQLKKNHLQVIFSVVGVVMLLLSVLTVVMPRNNSQMLNYTLWKQSAAIFFILSLAAFAGAFYI